jgi:transposase, IS30 family
MGQSYEQITDEERCLIDRLHAAGQSKSEIARATGRHRSTIFREIARNSTPVSRRYNAISADRMAFARCWRGSRIGRSSQLRETVSDRLAMGWSPEIIAGRLEQEHGSRIISHESIYRFIHSREGRSAGLYRYLRYRKAKRGWRARKSARVANIPERVSIHDRPPDIDRRESLGHWEGDLMCFADQKQALLVLHERKSRLSLTARLPDKRSETVAGRIVELLSPLPEKARKSITFDNGGEFAKHTKAAEKLGLKTYFCDPYASWQKGSVENSIGRLRTDLPRKTPLKHYSDQDIEDIIMNYNDTPRKCLGFQSPFKAFIKDLSETVALGM